MTDIKIKYILSEIDNIGITEKGQFWRLPFNTGPNYYGLKEIKPHLHQGKEYYRLFQKRYSKNNLRKILIMLRTPKLFSIPDITKTPF